MKLSSVDQLLQSPHEYINEKLYGKVGILTSIVPHKTSLCQSQKTLKFHLLRPHIHFTQTSFPGGKERPGRDADTSPPSSAVGHGSVELCLYSPYGPYGLYRASVPVQGVHFTFTLQ